MMIKSVLLPLPQPQAFGLFTAQISVWWPADRRHTKDPSSDIILEPQRFYERARDGTEVELGKVFAWDAPRRILLDFYIATGPNHPTEVEVRFEPEGAGTRITVTHRAKAESAHLWDARAPRYDRSWEVVLAALLAAAQRLVNP
jgi:activator of Hsp90 ATPase-like protein